MDNDLWVVLVVAAILLCLCWLAVPTRAPPEPPSAKQSTIFVLVPEVRTDVEHIFRQAHQPLRVFVGAGFPCEFQTNTRCVYSVLPPVGVAFARHTVFTNLYQDEDFVLCLGTGLELVRGWDVLVDEALQASAHVFSQWPVRDKADQQPTFPVFRTFEGPWPRFEGRSSQSLQPRSFEIGLASWQCFFARAAQAATLLRQPPLPLLTSTEDDLLLSFELFNLGLSVYTPAGRLVVRRLDDTSAGDSVAAGMAASLAAQRARQAAQHALPQRKELRAVTYRALSHLLHDRRVKHKSLPYYVLWRKRSRTARDFFMWLGVDIQQREAAGRAYLGLLRDFGTREILARYDSLNSFVLMSQR